MTVKDIIESEFFEVLEEGTSTGNEITKPFCCDLLSVAMGRAPEGGAWVTVMGNMNTLAVASLTDTACIILAEGAILDEQAKLKAKEQGISVFRTELPIYEAALWIDKRLNDETSV